MECKQSLNDAKKELSKNGWEQNNGILQKVIDDKAYKAELEIIYNEDNTQRQDTAEQVKQNLEELGIKVSVKSTSFEDYQTCINEGNYDIFVGSYIVSPDLKFSFILGEENIFGFESQEMTAAMDGLKTKHSIQGIEDGYSDVIDCFDKLNPVVGLFFEEKIMIYNNRISEEVKPSYFDVYKGIELLRKEERK